MVELLSPVGDFECLKAAVQNGANAVYFGANLFSARAFATNFNDDELEKAINYAHLRKVKTHLTLNTLIKDNEFEDAISIAKKAYHYGIDAIIVQDLGLATTLIKKFPDLPIHASTQMTTTNIEGVKKLEELGISRIVLSRESSLSEIKNICQNCKAEIEIFVHGALCISYSGECLFSSMVGGRSGNRGKCAQPCRLPYTLVDSNEKILDKGYLLSPRDLCALEFLPVLINAGVTSFKIEGRMKSPIYVATVTRIYRKYIDLALKYLNNEINEFTIDEKDKNDLLQVFNRGEFSSGHLQNSANQKLIFKDKPNNMGIYLGKILKYNSTKGLVTVKLENNVSSGDSISFENESSKYTISELMLSKNNIKTGKTSQIVTFGRMKGNIKPNDKIYKIADKELCTCAEQSFQGKEFIKNSLICKLDIHINEPINVLVKANNFNIDSSFVYNYIPNEAKSAPLTKENIIKQFNKTQNTCFEFSNFEICLDENLFIPTSILNDIRRVAISTIENKIIQSFKRTYNTQISLNLERKLTAKSQNNCYQKSLLLNVLNTSYDYSKLVCVDKIYIPLKYFVDDAFSKIIFDLSNKGKIYIYMPTIIRDNFINATIANLNRALENFKIDGFVVSNLSELNILKKMKLDKDYDLVANYTFNVFNSFSIEKLHEIGFNKITLSPELDLEDMKNILDINNELPELIAYSTIPLMNTNYCLLGKSNKCYSNCTKLCNSSNMFFLKDRYGFKFRVISDNSQTITTIYNSRITQVDYSKLDIKNLRFDMLDETIEEINSLIGTKLGTVLF